MTKEVVFKVGNFVTPIVTGNAIGVIYKCDENDKRPYEVIALNYNGLPNGESKRYAVEELQKAPAKYREGYPTGKAIIKAYDAL